MVFAVRIICGGKAYPVAFIATIAVTYLQFSDYIIFA